MKPTKSVNLSHTSGMAERKGDKVGGNKEQPFIQWCFRYYVKSNRSKTGVDL